MKFIKKNPWKSIFAGVCTAIIAVVLVFFVYTGRLYGIQAMNAFYLSADFCGSYQVADGEWMPYVKGVHIPADKGDVTLKGSFRLYVPTTGETVGNASSGMVLAFYFNHIGGEISEDGVEFRPFDSEHPSGGEDMCGEMYIGYMCGDTDEYTIRLKNPHKLGNPNAVDEFLDNLSIYGGTSFERDRLNRGGVRRIFGIVLILVAFMVLGTAIFARLIHLKKQLNLWLVGGSILFAGLYFIFSAHGIMFFSEIIKFNARMLVATMMLYMLNITAFISLQLKGGFKRIGLSLTSVSLASVLASMTAAMVFGIKFYDTLPTWISVQGLACLVMIAMLVVRVIKGEGAERIICAGGILPMVAFLVDAAATRFSLWQGGTVSEVVFILLFAASVILLLNIVPKNMSAAIRARELEAERVILKAELAESRIATLISQIQPHFIYNTLGTIEQLCITEPEAASKLVRNFSLYLRGNFRELDNPKPIRFSQEINHVKHYTDIEQVRFPDITIRYDLRSVEFLIPALSVQPLVENAIKHGLMGLEQGGIVTISAYETDNHYVVEVTDDGVGFDMSKGYDETKHVGIKNIRARIEAMCAGELHIESKVGGGTRATLKIPKEASENDSNNG